MAHPYRDTYKVKDMPNVNNVTWPTMPTWVKTVMRYVKNYAVGLCVVMCGILIAYTGGFVMTVGAYTVGNLVLHLFAAKGVDITGSDYFMLSWAVGLVCVLSVFWAPSLGRYFSL